MAAPTSQGRIGPALAAVVLAGGILSVGIIIAAYRLAGSIESWNPPREPTVIRPRVPLPDLTREAPAMALAGPGQMLIADGKGRVFLVGVEEEEDEAPRLALLRVYELRQDPERHLDEPALRSLAGWYLDDLAEERYRRVRAVREEFEGLIASGGTGAKTVGGLLALARGLVGDGDIPYLTERLADSSYLARRSAAIALGEAGWRRATPVLLEIVRQKDEKAFLLVGPILGDLTGIPAPDSSRVEQWLAAAVTWQKWWEDQK